MPASDAFHAAIERFDAENSQDPKGEELIYAQRMSVWLARIEPNASELLALVSADISFAAEIRVIGMSVRQNGNIDRPPGVDIKAAALAVKSAGRQRDQRSLFHNIILQ